MTARVQTRVSRVTLYRNGALVVRTGRAPIPPDDAVLLAGLPLRFRSASLRVRVLTAGLSAGPIAEHPELGLAPQGPDHQAAREALSAEERTLRAEAKQHRARQRSYAALELAPQPSKPANRLTSLPDLDGWAALDALSLSRREASAEAIAAIEDRLAEIGRERAALDAAPPVQSARLTRTLQAALRREGAADGDLEVEVEYFVPGVRWAPVYQVHVDTVARTATLEVSARVAQASGEDWSGVSVSVSTADLTRDAALPRLDSWRIGRHTPPSSDWRPLPDDASRLFADFDAAPRKPSAAPPRPPPPPQRTRSRAPVVADIEEDEESDDDDDFGIIDDGIANTGAIAPPMPKSMPSPAPMMAAAAPRREEAKSKKRRSRGGKGRPPGAPTSSSSLAPEEAGFGPDAGMMDYAWLRLAPATDRRRRGKLLPVTMVSDIEDLLEGREGSAALLGSVKKALAALAAQQRTLERAPLPSGCFDVRTASFYHRYAAGPRVDLPADGRFRQIQIARAVGDCALILRAVPRQDARAFRFATLHNPIGQPLLPGPLQVYMDGAFVVTSALKVTGAADTLMLNLGVEDRVRIARNATHTQSEHGMFSTTSRLEHVVETEVRSNLSAPVEISIQERLPIDGGSDGIEIELAHAAPEPVEGRGLRGEPIPGALLWTLTLQPGTSQSLRYRYTIDISARKELVGGNRREP